jgi:hypothetical protein
MLILSVPDIKIYKIISLKMDSVIPKQECAFVPVEFIGKNKYDKKDY